MRYMVAIAALLTMIETAQSEPKTKGDIWSGLPLPIAKKARCEVQAEKLIGLSSEELLDKCGFARSNKTITAYGKHEQFVFNASSPTMYVYTVDGIVVSVQK
jgi:hypothetical protein